MTYPVLEEFATNYIPTNRGYVMSKNKIIELKKPGEISGDLLTELLRIGAQRLIADAVEAELQELLGQLPSFGRSMVFCRSFVMVICPGGRFKQESVR